MKTFIYYNKLDTTKEPLGRIQADNEDEAGLVASSIKRIPLVEFLKIFKLEEI